jgi:tagaturonate epimerase
VTLPTGTTIDLNEQAVMRAAVKYGRAINRAVRMAQHIEVVHKKLGRAYEIELSVDETPQPTTLAEHWIIAEQCLARGMKLVSLAPRYVGDFEKGVDYKGDVHVFEKSLADHVAVMEQLGPYKLSLHSGSDKLSIYTSFARITKGRWHVKTAGTSYLEMLRVVARHDAKLFAEVVDFARAHYDADKATYHVSAIVGAVPAPKDVKDERTVERLYLELWEDVKPGLGFTQPGRQILHCTCGSVLTDPVMAAAVRQVVEAHAGTYTEVLKEHFAKHLEALNKGMG